MLDLHAFVSVERLTALKAAFRERFPTIKPTHRVEMIAAAFGFGSNAALQAAVDAAPDGRVLTTIDEMAAIRRLAAMTGQEILPVVIANYGEVWATISTAVGGEFVLTTDSLTKSGRFAEWCRKICTSCHSIVRMTITMNKAGPGTEERVANCGCGVTTSIVDFNNKFTVIYHDGPIKEKELNSIFRGYHCPCCDMQTFNSVPSERRDHDKMHSLWLQKVATDPYLFPFCSSIETVKNDGIGSAYARVRSSDHVVAITGAIDLMRALYSRSKSVGLHTTLSHPSFSEYAAAYLHNMPLYKTIRHEITSICKARFGEARLSVLDPGSSYCAPPRSRKKRQP